MLMKKEKLLLTMQTIPKARTQNSEMLYLPYIRVYDCITYAVIQDVLRPFRSLPMYQMYHP